MKMTIEAMALDLLHQWPIELTPEDAALLLDAMLSVQGGIDPADVDAVVVVDGPEIQIQLHINEDKMPVIL
jgi:hypothetical protein